MNAKHFLFLVPTLLMLAQINLMINIERGAKAQLPITKRRKLASTLLLVGLFAPWITLAFAQWVLQ